MQMYVLYMDKQATCIYLRAQDINYNIDNITCIPVAAAIGVASTCNSFLDNASFSKTLSGKQSNNVLPGYCINLQLFV